MFHPELRGMSVETPCSLICCGCKLPTSLPHSFLMKDSAAEHLEEAISCNKQLSDARIGHGFHEYSGRFSKNPRKERCAKWKVPTPSSKINRLGQGSRTCTFRRSLHIMSRFLTTAAQNLEDSTGLCAHINHFKALLEIDRPASPGYDLMRSS